MKNDPAGIYPDNSDAEAYLRIRKLWGTCKSLGLTIKCKTGYVGTGKPNDPAVFEISKDGKHLYSNSSAHKVEGFLVGWQKK